jgi:hypothetical protein
MRSAMMHAWYRGCVCVVLELQCIDEWYCNTNEHHKDGAQMNIKQHQITGNGYTNGRTSEYVTEQHTSREVAFKIKGASVIIHRSKAYIPVEAEIEGGPYVAIDPVFISNLLEDDMVEAFEKVIAAGHPKIDPPATPSEWRRRRDPVLAATRVRSWRQLDKESAFYGIWWHDGQVTLYLHPLDQDRAPLMVRDRVRTFPADTSLRTIVKTILTDVRKLSQVGDIDFLDPVAEAPPASRMRVLCQ